MTKRIENLTLEGFRGATCPVQLDFDVNKPVAMIFGENGTGKSTIADAIDFICNGEPGSLTDRSSTNARSHLPSLGKHAKDLSVSLSFGGQTWTAALGKKGAETTGPLGLPKARILRRSKILDVVNAEPKKRYEALHGFVAVPNVQTCENSLRDAVKAVEQDLNEARRAAQQAEESLVALWKAAGSPAEGCWPWAKNECVKDSTSLRAEVNAVEKVLAELTECIQARERLEKAEADHKGAEVSLTKAKESFGKAQAKTAGITASLIGVLKDAQTYLEENAAARNCPVCEQTIDAKRLQSRIAERLAEIKGAVLLRNAVDDACIHVRERFAVVLTQQQALGAASKKLVALTKQSAFPEINALGIDWSKFPLLSDTKSETVKAEFAKESRDLLAIVQACQLPLKTRHTSCSKTLNLLTAIRNHVSSVEEKTASAQSLHTVLKRALTMLEVVEEARKAYVEGVLASISGIVEELYQKVHPEEGIGGIRFYLNPKYQGSLEFDGKFQFAKEVPPQAYYSESHLETLGVCIFLALARYFHEGNTVVVLDDVLTSVDQAHVGRLIHMLHDEAARYSQLIITTHYRPWRECYRFGRGPGANVQLIELLHWSLPRGIRHTKTRIAVDELRDVLAREPLDRQSVSSKAGILMESLLDHLALLYECRLPRKAEPNYTLGELTGCIGSKLRKAVKIERVSEKTKPDEDPKVISHTTLDGVLTAISGVNWIRNQVGCHWSLSGLEVSNSEVKEFGNLTIKFADALLCEHCGEAPHVEKAGAYHQCRCGRARLYPCNNPD